MPLIMRFVLVNALESGRLATGENSLQLAGYIQLQSGKSRWRISTPVSFQSAALVFSTAFCSPPVMRHHGRNHGEQLSAGETQPCRIEFRVGAGRRSATLEEVWIDRGEVEPGDTMTVLPCQGFSRRGKLFQQKITIPQMPRKFCHQRWRRRRSQPTGRRTFPPLYLP
jgi:hypothetical protein